MPADNMKVASGKLIRFLNEKWGARACPMCNKGPWEVQGKIFQLSEFSGGGFVVGGPLIPVIPVSCSNCGHTVLVNALISGILQNPADQQERPDV